jgi:3-deoxy-D-manno-octulosonate 8-phosphate phosphatase (KDO 8-P phosphatase)
MAAILAVALDVDGVLTDGMIYWDGNGGEWKRFSFRDIMGVSLGKKAGLRFALISGEDSLLVDRYAAKMGIEDVYKGCKDKAAAVKDFAGKRGLALEQVCFMGDDVNDVAAMQAVGLAAAPADAHEAARAAAKIITVKAGGQGAVRELIDRLLRNRATANPV